MVLAYSYNILFHLEPVRTQQSPGVPLKRPSSEEFDPACPPGWHQRRAWEGGPRSEKDPSHFVTGSGVLSVRSEEKPSTNLPVSLSDGAEQRDDASPVGLRHRRALLQQQAANLQLPPTRRRSQSWNAQRIRDEMTTATIKNSFRQVSCLCRSVWRAAGSQPKVVGQSAE